MYNAQLRSCTLQPFQSRKKKIGWDRLTQNETYSLSFSDVSPSFHGQNNSWWLEAMPLLETQSRNNNNQNVKEAESNPWRCRRMRNNPCGNDSKCSSFFFLGVAGRWAVVSWQRCHRQPVSSWSAERIIHQGLIRGRKTTRCLAAGAACASEYYWSTRQIRCKCFGRG